MTRTQFIEDITTWYELLEFCSDEGCDEMVEDVYSDDAKDEYIDNDLTDMARNADSWRDLYRMLDDIPTGYDYYIMDEYGNFRDADDDDFDRYKDDVLDWGDGEDIWEPEEEEADEDDEPEDDEIEDEEDDFVVDEGCSIGELFSAGASCLRTIKADESNARAEADKEFALLF